VTQDPPVPGAVGARFTRGGSKIGPGMYKVASGRLADGQ